MLRAAWSLPRRRRVHVRARGRGCGTAPSTRRPKVIRRGTHRSVQALEADIRTWIQTWNEYPRPFVWTKTADEILNSLAKYIAKISGARHYLPANVGVRATFWWTYLPSAVSAVWVFVLGSAVAAVEPEQSDPVTAFKAAGDSLAPGLGWAIVLLLFLALLAIMAINQYGGSLGIISIMDSFRPVAATRGCGWPPSRPWRWRSS
ncbi:hypothetical protein ACMXN5_30610 [Embleya sp. MST-111070]